MSLPETPSPPRHGRASRDVAWLSWFYVLLLFAVWALLATEGDQWWPATLILFLPRWAWGVPLVVLGLAAVLFRPRMLGLLLLGGVVVAWPLMGLCIPWDRLSAQEEKNGFRCRVFTCNVHRNPFGVKPTIRDARPDVVALQDCSGDFAPHDFGEGEWHVQARGQFVVASRYPIREFIELEPPAAPKNTVVRAILETPVGPVRLYNLHLASPREGLVAVRQRGWNGGHVLQSNSNARRTQSVAIDAWIRKEAGPLVIVGDFNTPTDSTIYGAVWAKYTNAFSEAGLGWGYTYYTSRTSLRIDHILAGPGWRCRDCWVGPEVGSEHRPVIADLEWVAARP